MKCTILYKTNVIMSEYFTKAKVHCCVTYIIPIIYKNVAVGDRFYLIYEFYDTLIMFYAIFQIKRL